MIQHTSSLWIGIHTWAERSTETLYVDQKSIFSNYVHNVVSRCTLREVVGADSESAGEGGRGGEGWGGFMITYAISSSVRRDYLRLKFINTRETNSICFTLYPEAFWV